MRSPAALAASLAACALLPLLLLAPSAAALSKTGLPDGFVSVQNGRFVVGDACSPFIFAGWNQVIEQSSQAPCPPARCLPRPGKVCITDLMDVSVAAGMKVVRMWAHSITPGWSMHPSPGVHNDTIARGMDFVMDEAAKRGLRIIWVITDNWYKEGGIDQFVAWGATRGTTLQHADFYTNGRVKALYKNHVAWLLDRVNTINGKRYGDDPTVMAWNLANEARCTGCGNAPMQDWVTEMCSFVKSHAPRQLVGIGYEGFYGVGSPQVGLNPGGVGSTWASQEGQNFVQNAQIPCVDYVGVHVWPDNWNAKSPAFVKQFITDHVADVAAHVPGKPFVLEEYGKIVDPKHPTDHTERNAYMTSAFQAAEGSASTGGPLAGSLFWHLYDAGVGPGQYGVHVTDTTWLLITAHAKDMAGYAGPGCGAVSTA